MEIQKTLNSQSNLKKEEWNNLPDFRLYYKPTVQDSMVLAQRQKYRSMEQNRKPRDKSTHIWTPSEKAMEPHSSTLAWKIPWMEEPGGLQSMGSLRVRHDWATSLSLFAFKALEKEMATHSSVLAWRIPGTGEPGGLPSMGSHRIRHDWSDLAAAAAISYIGCLVSS